MAVRTLKKIYFFDDFLFEESQRLRRVFGRAARDPAVRDEKPGQIFYDTLVGRYRKYCDVDRKDDRKDEASMGLLESDDAIRWEPVTVPPDTDRYTRLNPHILLTTGPGEGPGSIYLDEEDPDPRRRYKASSAAGILYTSPDGIRWTALKERPPWGIWHSDSNNQIWYNPVRKTWQLSFRPESGDRRVFVCESSDLKNWSVPICAIMLGPRDPVGTEFYSLHTYKFQDIFVGTAVYCLFTPNIGQGVVWRISAILVPELVYSYDGLSWTRTEWRELVPLSPPGEMGEAMMFVNAAFNDPGDPSKIRLFAMAEAGEHGPAPAGVVKHPAGFNEGWQYRLRREGWVYLKSTGDLAYLRSRPMETTSGKMSLNVLCPNGMARVQFCDLNGKPYPGFTFADCEPICGDYIEAVPRWKNKENFAELIGKIFKIEIQLFAGELYCINGDWYHYCGDLPVGTFDWDVTRAKCYAEWLAEQKKAQETRVGPRER